VCQRSLPPRDQELERLNIEPPTSASEWVSRSRPSLKILLSQHRHYHERLEAGAYLQTVPEESLFTETHR